MNIQLNQGALKENYNSLNMQFQPKKQEVLQKMKQQEMYWQLKMLAQTEFAKTNGLMKLQDLQKFGAESGMTQKLQENELKTKEIQRKEAAQQMNEALPLLSMARTKWTKFIHEQIVISSRENKLSKQKIAENNNNNTVEEEINYIYDDEQFLEFISKIADEQLEGSNKIIDYNNEMIQLSLPGINSKYEEIIIKYQGITNTNSNSNEKQCRKILSRQKQTNAEIEQLCKNGLPNSMRSFTYAKYFKIDPEQETFQTLEDDIFQKQGKKYSHFFESLLEADANEILDYDHYFIFCEQITRMVKVLFFDKEIKSLLKILPTEEFLTDKEKNKISISNLIPCKLFSKYFAPFCFLSPRVKLFQSLFEQLDLIYPIFRMFYTQYFCYLNSISSHPSSIIPLCISFEKLFVKKEPKL